MLPHYIIGEVLRPAVTVVLSPAKLARDKHVLGVRLQEAADDLFTQSHPVYVGRINKIATGISKCF